MNLPTKYNCVNHKHKNPPCEDCVEWFAGYDGRICDLENLSWINIFPDICDFDEDQCKIAMKILQEESLSDCEQRCLNDVICLRCDVYEDDAYLQRYGLIFPEFVSKLCEKDLFNFAGEYGQTSGISRKDLCRMIIVGQLEMAKKVKDPDDVLKKVIQSSNLFLVN